MIILKDLFDTLAYGELANLSMGNSSLGVLVESNYPKVVSHINLGLVELYKRFNLRQGERRIHQYPGITTYYLRSERANVGGEFDEFYYLEDDFDDPFEDDVIKIIQVFDETGNELRLNDTRSDAPILTPSFDIIRMTPSDPPQILSFVYQARYPRIIVDETFDPLLVELHIPDFIVEALLAYVAARLYKPVSSDGEGGSNPSNTFMAQYELACKKIELYSLPTEVNDTRDRFTANGWV